MPQKCSAQSEVEQFKVKGKELIALALSILAKHDEREALPRSSISTIRRRAIVLLEGSVSFVEVFLRLQDCDNGGGSISD